MVAMFKCHCENVAPGSYANQIWVHAPSHMPKENGYCLDRCVADEVMALWMLGVTTTGCCCGHGQQPPFIGVSENDIPVMKRLGYEVHYNIARPADEDSFIPMGKEHVHGIIKQRDLRFDINISNA